MYLFVFIDRIIHRRDSQDFFKEPVRTVPEQDIEKAAKNEMIARMSGLNPLT